MIREPVYRQEEDYDQLPMGSAEDVEYSEELADHEDIEAQQRAAEADRRAAAYEGD
ncbi:YfhD family protein [Cohnella pontilimi]|uniref:YfhD family protein n=2 Tax=Cohnella pontilimi TaxID=2564100 RepID=A0A4U0FFF8_9BACL|nr:YfhD family protein [Cohnella pontilimi]